MADIRCDHKLHGILTDDYIEVACQSSYCGKKPGVLVLHRFDITTGKLIETLRFKEPARRTDAPRRRISVRSA